ncbi:MAG: hypothetical protein M1831_006526 [Alyxoria varia]|nr:MAG: hypothetical protein M1831_006526 [Alyxoria varia]
MAPPKQPERPLPLDGQDVLAIPRDRIVESLRDSYQVYLSGGTRIARISTSVCVKYGPAVRLWEAKTMRLVHESCTLRLPQVLDAWSRDKTEELQNPTHYEKFWNEAFEEPTTYIMMTYIPGKTMEDCWPTLDSGARHRVAEQLSEALHQLHGIVLEQPGPIGGGLSQGAWFTDFGAGPFSSAAQMEAWFNERREVCRDFNRIGESLPSFDGKFSRLVMCHMDLHFQNMRLDDKGQVWLLDWAHAGAYPVYFEKASVTRYGHWPKELNDVCFNGVTHENDEENIDQLFAIMFALTTGAFCKPRGSNGLTEGTFQLPHK